jgi:hypothetical protein
MISGKNSLTQIHEKQAIFEKSLLKLLPSSETFALYRHGLKIYQKSFSQGKLKFNIY